MHSVNHLNIIRLIEIRSYIVLRRYMLIKHIDDKAM